MFVNINQLTKKYGQKDQPIVMALNQVSLSFEKGEFIAIMGPSGSGKSTFLHLLGGLDRPTGGQIIVNDQDIARLKEEQLAVWRRRCVGFVFQSFNLIPMLNAKDNVRLPMLIDGKSEKEADRRANELLDLVGLSDRANHKPSQLSGGQQQRAAIARALSVKPDLILADEPTGALDSETSIKVISFLRKLSKEQNQTIVMVTHNKEIASFADRNIQFKDGKVMGKDSVAVSIG